jgi:hypothetical protein
MSDDTFSLPPPKRRDTDGSQFRRPVPQWMVWALMGVAGVGGPVMSHNDQQDKIAIISSLRSQIEAANQDCTRERLRDMRDDMHRGDDLKTNRTDTP